MYQVTIGDKVTRVRAESVDEAFDKALVKCFGRAASWLPDSAAPGRGQVFRRLTIRQGAEGRADFTTSVTGRVSSRVEAIPAAAHRHAPAVSSERAWQGCVTPWACNPGAHGNITRREECSCGAHRAVSINGNHREAQHWV